MEEHFIASTCVYLPVPTKPNHHRADILQLAADMMQFAQIDSRDIDGHGGDHEPDGYIGQYKWHEYRTGQTLDVAV